MLGRVLIIAGSDSGGGAGIQGDIKTVTALGGYAATAVTALTAQNTLGVSGIYDIAPDFVRLQIKSVLSDIGADTIKTGMLHRADIIHAAADALAEYPDIPRVIDPVMVAKGGAILLEPDALEALRTRIFPGAALITPNIPEAELLSGRKINSFGDMSLAGKDILYSTGAGAVLVKGGHLSAGEEISNMLVNKKEVCVFKTPRLVTRHTHGTGCAIASAIATGLAQGMRLVAAIERAQEYVLRAIENAPGHGSGHGPLNHAHTLNGITCHLSCPEESRESVTS